VKIVARGKDGFGGFFGNAVPFAAIVALALPAIGDGAALLADEFALCLGHARPMARLCERFKNKAGESLQAYGNQRASEALFGNEVLSRRQL
jgi:hypothetical protein